MLKITTYAEGEATTLELDPNKTLAVGSPLTVRFADGDSFIIKTGTYHVSYLPDDDDPDGEVGWLVNDDDFKVFFDAHGHCSGWEAMPRPTTSIASVCKRTQLNPAQGSRLLWHVIARSTSTRRSPFSTTCE